MKARAAKKVFLQRLEEAGLKLDKLTPAEGVAAMLAFYADERAEGCEFDDDGDMLLFQWGVYDDEPVLEIDITRQLMESGDDGEPRQLNLTFKFKSQDVPPKLDVGNKWCESPKKLAAFRKFITSHKSLKAVGSRKPVKVELSFGRT